MPTLPHLCIYGKTRGSTDICVTSVWHLRCVPCNCTLCTTLISLDSMPCFYINAKRSRKKKFEMILFAFCIFLTLLGVEADPGVDDQDRMMERMNIMEVKISPNLQNVIMTDTFLNMCCIR